MGASREGISERIYGIAVGLGAPFALLPFVAGIELVVLLVLGSDPSFNSLVVALLSIALVEEVAKASVPYLALRWGLLGRRRVMELGFVVGVGFFLAERTFRILVALSISGSPQRFGVPSLWDFLRVKPLLLHSSTSTLSAWGVSKGRGWILLALSLSVLLHFLYNVGVLGGVL